MVVAAISVSRRSNIMYKDVIGLLLEETVVMVYSEPYETYPCCGVLSKENSRYFVRNNCDVVSFPHNCIQEILICSQHFLKI